MVSNDELDQEAVDQERAAEMDRIAAGVIADLDWQRACDEDLALAALARQLDAVEREG